MDFCYMYATMLSVNCSNKSFVKIIGYAVERRIIYFFIILIIGKTSTMFSESPSSKWLLKVCSLKV